MSNCLYFIGKNGNFVVVVVDYLGILFLRNLIQFTKQYNKKMERKKKFF